MVRKASIPGRPEQFQSARRGRAARTAEQRHTQKSAPNVTRVTDHVAARWKNGLTEWFAAQPRTSIPEMEGKVVMFTNANTATASIAAPGLRRRSLLGMVVVGATPLSWRALAAAAPADATATIEHFSQALLAAMKSGQRTDFSRRFRALAPEVDQAFDLPAVLAVSVGSGWAGLSAEQQSRLLDTFRRYTVASYVANFDSYAGQSFTVSPDTRSLGAGRVIVQSHIAPISGDVTELDYVMQQTPSGWKIVDVLAAGSISRVAVQRSDFRRVLSSGGGEALLASLQRKTSDLSGGALA
jgi:phospholipid transport system substrate-binding protein